jgi:8-oxo-dGTP pyrophosphatase MutT (NUDIX family)
MHKFKLIVDEMTVNEKNKIRSTNDFTRLWADMWNVTYESNKLDAQNNKLCKKYNEIKSGIVVEGKNIQLNDIIETSQTSWSDPEWEFPKGRRIAGESDLKCALREFEEETGIQSSSIKLLKNVAPLNEVFIGSNLKSYQNTYFVAYADVNISSDTLENYQKAEVSSIEWKSYNKCMNDIRPYNLEKKEILTNINNMLQSYECLEF